MRAIRESPLRCDWECYGRNVGAALAAARFPGRIYSKNLTLHQTMQGHFALYAGLPRIFSMTLYSGLYSVRVNTKFPAQWTRSKVMPLTQ